MSRALRYELSTSLLNNPPPIGMGKSKLMVHDAKVTGLHAVIYKTGKITFGVKWKLGGRTKAITLGHFGVITLEQARKAARAVWAARIEGRDPHAERQRHRAAVTVEEFINDEFLPHQRVRKKSAKEDEHKCKKRVIPLWGRRLLSDITTADVARLHDAIVAEGRTKATANRYLAMVKRMFALAMLWGRLPSNPARAVKLHRENNQRDRFLSVEDMRRLLSAIATDSDIVGSSAIAFLLATGARRMEALSALWDDVDMEKGMWTLPTTKAGRRAYKPLNSVALRILRSLHETRQNAFVFPAITGESHRKTLDTVWKRLCSKAGLVGFRLHDLRHSYASLLVSKGVSLFAVSRLLNHASPMMTQRYSHLAPAELAGESEKAAQVIETASAGSV